MQQPRNKSQTAVHSPHMRACSDPLPIVCGVQSEDSCSRQGSLHRPLLVGDDDLFNIAILHSCDGTPQGNLQVQLDRPAAQHELPQLIAQVC